MTDPSALILAFERAIRSHLRDDADDGFHTYDVGTYYPHSIGYCPLRYYYIYKYAKSAELTDEDLNITTAGRIVHDLIQSPLRRLGYDVEKEVYKEIAPGIRIVGRVDAYWSGGRLDVNDSLVSEFLSSLPSDYLPPHLVEIKSTNHLPANPYDKHLLQIQAYLHIVPSDFAVLIYVSRYNFSRRYFVVEPDESLYRLAIDWVLHLHESLVNNAPPEPSPVADWECQKCPLLGTCPLHRNRTLEQYLVENSTSPPKVINKGSH